MPRQLNGRQRGSGGLDFQTARRLLLVWPYSGQVAELVLDTRVAIYGRLPDQQVQVIASLASGADILTPFYLLCHSTRHSPTRKRRNGPS
jgi:hypothetical protein